MYDAKEKTETTEDYYKEFMTCFVRDEAVGETRIKDPMQLLNLLLSQNELIFRWLTDIKNAQEQGALSSGSPDGKQEARKRLLFASCPLESTVLLSLTMP